MNIVSYIKTNTDKTKDAFVVDDLSISYGDLFGFVSELTQQLKQWSLYDKHEVPRIGVKAPNGIGYIIIALSVLESGACFIPIPDELTQPEVDHLIRETGAHGVVCQQSEFSDFALPLQFGYLSLQKTDSVRDDFPELAFNQLNPAFIRFSSGTTAHSKGVVLSHESLLDRVSNANEALQLKAGEKVLWTLPMAHHFAVSIILYLKAGVTTILEENHDPETIYLRAKEHGVHFFYGSPFHYAQLALYKKGERLPSLRLAVSTAAALTKEVADAFQQRYQLPLCNALGIIEIGLPIINLLQPEDHSKAIGQVLPAYEWRLQNQDENGLGELELKGSGMFDAYLSPWQTREEITDAGWFATGDLAKEVSRGTLQLTGRKKSVINVAGMKVFPEEVEACLESHPKIKKAKVYPLAHPVTGNMPICDYIPLETQDTLPAKELRGFCAERLSSYKIPIQFRAVDCIELTASGKVKRHSV